MTTEPFVTLKTSFPEPEKMPSAADQCRLFVILAGGDREWGDNRQTWLARAAHRLGIPQSRAVSLFYRKTPNVKADEFLMLQARARQLELAATRRRILLEETDASLRALARDMDAAGGARAGRGVDLAHGEGAADRRPSPVGCAAQGQLPLMAWGEPE